MNSLWTVIRYTYRNRIASKAFIVTTIIFALVISLGIHLPAIISLLTSGKPAPVGMIEDRAGIAAALKNGLGAIETPKAEIKLYPDAGSPEANDVKLRDELEKGEIKGYLLPKSSPSNGFPAFEYKSLKVPGGTLKGQLTSTLNSIKNDAVVRDLQLSAEQISRLSASVSIESVQLSTTDGEGGKTEQEREVAYVLVYVLLFFLFMMVLMYGNMIATEITAEKSSRVMEILITSVSPLTQMFGKIIGIFLIAMTQTLVFVLTIAINLLLASNIDTPFKLGPDLFDPLLVFYFLLYFVLGFFMYATLLAGVGSLVSRTEDLGQAITPVTILSLIGFYISVYGLSDPNSMFISAMSYVPFFTPMLMFLRIGMVGVPFWEIALSFVILIASILLFGYLAAKMYRVGVLMYGKRPSWKELWKAMKAYNV
jgi:ABC-2 type transport system permease protein